jgi:manganese/zinc/iron transport system permease protein
MSVRGDSNGREPGPVKVLLPAGAVILLAGFFLLPFFPENLWQVLFLRDYNTRLVVLSTALLGMSSGLTGSFLLLRRRSLMGDALSHATLPGIAIAFWALVALGAGGKALPPLLAGAFLSGVAGIVAVLWIRKLPRIREDTALGIVLSVFYGAGVALLALVQQLPGASAAGLESFIYGKTASMLMSDFLLLAGLGVVVLLVLVLLFKELQLLAFDEAFAASCGWPVGLLDLLLLTLVCVVTVAGLQAVGLILIIAFLVIPPAAARMWTGQLRGLLIGAALIGGLCGWCGASLSALAPGLPAGALIVLTGAGIFIASAILGTERGLLLRMLRHSRLKRRIERQHLLRALYEARERSDGNGNGVPPSLKADAVGFADLLRMRSWTPPQLQRILRRAAKEGLLEWTENNGIQPTALGEGEAQRVTRNHRLWECYLIEYAEVAPSQVDRDADSVEHVLGEKLTRELERRLPEYLQSGALPVPRSPHPLRKQSI